MPSHGFRDRLQPVYYSCNKLALKRRLVRIEMKLTCPEDDMSVRACDFCAGLIEPEISTPLSVAFQAAISVQRRTKWKRKHPRSIAGVKHWHPFICAQDRRQTGTLFILTAVFIKPSLLCLRAGTSMCDWPLDRKITTYAEFLR